MHPTSTRLGGKSWIKLSDHMTEIKPNEAPCNKLWNIEAEFAEANSPSHKASTGHLAIPACIKLQGILAKANEGD
jgi:hypothetical protein